VQNDLLGDVFRNRVDMVKATLYSIVIILHGQGNKRDLAKTPIEVRQIINPYRVENIFKQHMSSGLQVAHTG